MRKIVYVLGGILIAYQSNFVLSFEKGSDLCTFIEPATYTMSVDDLYDQISSDQEISRDELIKILENKPRTISWESVEAAAIANKVQQSDFVVTAQILPYESLVWKSQSIVNRAKILNAEIPIHILDMHKWDVANKDSKSSEQDEVKEIGLVVSTKLLYDPKTQMGVSELKEEIEAYQRAIRDKRSRLYKAAVEGSITEEKLTDSLAILDKERNQHPYGKLEQLPEQITIYLDGGPINELCGFNYLESGKKYLFFLKRVGGQYLLDGPQAVISAKYAEILDQIRQKAPSYFSSE